MLLHLARAKTLTIQFEPRVLVRQTPACLPGILFLSCMHKKMIQKKTDDHLKAIATEHEQAKWLLDDRERGLKAREVLNDSEKRKLNDEKKRMVETLDPNKAAEKVLNLANDQKREIETLHQKIVRLQKKRDEKQRLEQMKGVLELMILRQSERRNQFRTLFKKKK
uniref:Uncharacterized protein n=1 Tax=Helianthus annuus TaxID=4232 RepID=A0A251ULM8_HELAN